VQYRKAVPADAPALAEFGARLFVDSYQHVTQPAELTAYVREHFTRERQQAELSDPGMTTFLALNPEICGYAQLTLAAAPECVLAGRAPAALQRIYVDRAWHGRGVAQELLRLVEAEARRQRCDQLWLAVWEINDRAIAFYAKQGFTFVGRQGFPMGSENQTDHVMAKALATELQ
jgi:ribosomal protein S18 acetylase RimI-like enzyme